MASLAEMVATERLWCRALFLSRAPERLQCRWSDCKQPACMTPDCPRCRAQADCVVIFPFEWILCARHYRLANAYPTPPVYEGIEREFLYEIVGTVSA